MPDFIWVELNGMQTAVDSGFAKRHGLTQVAKGDPATDERGAALSDRRANGRPNKPRTSVASSAKKAAPADQSDAEEAAS